MSGTVLDRGDSVTDFEQYFTSILDGKIIACEKMKRISEQLLNDFNDPGEYHFDHEIAERHVKFIETFCKLPSGDIGKPLKLETFQKARLQALFGFVDDNNMRRFNECLIIEARKSGKTTETAAVELDLLMNDREGAPQIYNVATALDQAKLGFNAAYKMVQQSPLLRKHIRKRAADLYCARNFGFIKAIASNSNTMDGLDVHGAVIDELAAIKNRDIYDLIKQAMGARRQPLLFCITTSGFVRESIYDAQYEYASNVINGVVQDKHFLPFIYELDDPAEWQDETKWIKANPGLGTIKSVDYLRQMVEKGKADPSFKPTVLVKDFNVKQSEASAWLTFEAVVNETVVELKTLEHSYAIGGCDLSSTTDLTCATLLIRKPGDENVYVLQHYFIPEKKLNDVEATQSQEAPYKLWREQGWLTACEGAQVDYHAVTEWFAGMVEKHDIRPLWVCYDRALSGYWVPEMEEYGFDMEKTAQGPFTWSQPMKEMGAAFTEHRVVYNNNPILRWCLLNTAVKSNNKDGIETIQPIKIQQHRRIDGMVSLLNAWVGYVKHFNEYMPYVR